jgi:hypothetical protein
MKPYKLIKSSSNVKKRINYINPLKAVKIPFKFFKDVSKPNKREISKD